MTYDFTEDWFSQHIPLFEKYLKPLIGLPCCLLEIGSYEGRSAIWLLENICTNREATLTCIDPYDRFLTNIKPCTNDKFLANIKASKADYKVTFYNKESYVAIRSLPFDTFDFVYIDGDHSPINVLEDAVNTFRLVKVGGIIAFDDYLWDDTDYGKEGTPKSAIDVFLKIYKDKIEILEMGYQVWVRKMSV